MRFIHHAHALQIQNHRLFVLYGRNSNDEWVVETSAEAQEVMRDHHNQCVERWNADDGPLAYHIRAGDHDLNPFDWRLYLDHADQIWPRE